MIWFYKLEQKYGKYAIRNLTWYLIIGYAIGYVLQLSAGLGNTVTASLLSYLTLDIHAVLHGQIWRLVTWLLIPPYSFDIFTLVTLYCYFSIGTLLERTWGTFRYNVYIFSGIIFTIIGAFLLYGIMYLMLGGSDMELVSTIVSNFFSTYYISMSLFFAFAITFPDMQMMFMFIIPIKAKVLGIFYVLIMVYNIFQNFSLMGPLVGTAVAIVIGFSLLNVLLFFIVTRKNFRTPTQIKRQKEFQRHTVKMKKVTRHKCAICGRSEETDPDEQFRFCSKCEGNYEYCSKHIYTHTHVKKGQ